MKRKKGIFWGGVFLLVAAYIIVGSLGYFGNLGFWTLLFTVFLGAWFLQSLFHLSFGGMLFSLAFLAILYDEMLSIEALTPWPVLFAALFGTIGLNLIFRRSKSRRYWNFSHRRNDSETERTEVLENDPNGAHFRCSKTFGSAVRYVKSQRLEQVTLENAFGSLVVYLDEARPANGQVSIYAENSFGKLELYVPKAWKVRLQTAESFGHVEEFGSAASDGAEQAVIVAETAFGSIEIHYV
ncbi:MAG: LiaF-related protein [Lachnospiraceae bacterium]|nr:LiaF-related protein [Lachnospiraceae bacterium]